MADGTAPGRADTAFAASVKRNEKVFIEQWLVI